MVTSFTKYKVISPGKLLILAVAILFAVFASKLLVVADTPDLSANDGFESVELTWVIEEDGFEVDDLEEFEVEWREQGTSDWVNSVTLDDLDGTEVDDDEYEFEYTVTAGGGNALDPGQEYQFRVTAYYNDGENEDDFTSSNASATPYTFPDAPEDFVAEPGHELVELSWEAPDDNGSAITGYALRYQVADSDNWQQVDDLESEAAAEGFTVTNLTNGTAYEFEVAAINASINEDGMGLDDLNYTTSVSATPNSDAPQNLDPEAGDRQVTLTWNEPALDPEGVEGYEVHFREHGEDAWVEVDHDPATDTSVTVTGLENGQGYDFQVAAVWDDDAGTAASVSNVVPFTVVPNNGDANGDGVHDADQNNVTTFENPVTGTYAVLESTCENVAAAVNDESANASADAGFEFPVGLMSFTLTCTSVGETATITQYFYGTYDAELVVLRKYSPSADSYRTIGHAVAENVNIGGQQVLKVTYEVTDGGEFDEGPEDGEIVDPAGPGFNVAGVPNTGVGGQAAMQQALQLLRSE